MTVSPPQRRLNSAEQAAQAATCFDLKLKGKNLREIGAELGISYETVRRRLDFYIEEFVSPKVEVYRTVQDGQLDALETHLWAQLDDPTLGLDDRLRVVSSMLKLMERRAKLHGADAPVKVEGTVVHETEQDVEIRALLQQAQAQNARKAAELASSEQ